MRKTRLTDFEKNNIMKMYNGGNTYDDIRNKTNRSKSTITKVVKNGCSGIDNLIKRISGKYFDFNNFKRLFLKNIDIVKPANEKIDSLEYLKYTSGNRMLRRGDHIGQRKLLLNEIQFLTKYPQKICIYAGSAPGNKTHLLSSLFPDIKFILIDPNKFSMVITDTQKNHRNLKHRDIVHLYSGYPSQSNEYINKKESDMSIDEKKTMINFIKTSQYKIFVIEDYMNNNYAELFKQLGETTFISDIRSNTSEKGGNPLDIDIYWNSSMMYNWMNILKPICSMLKIRMPYGTDTNIKYDMYMEEFDYSKKLGVDFIVDHKNNRFKFCKSEIYLQAWAGQSSSEMRMYIEKKNITKLMTYDISDIEGRMFYLNLIDRTWHLHKNENTSKKLNFCHCNDCALENLIWTDYILKYNHFIKDVHSAVELVDSITHRPLSKVHTATIWSNVALNKNIFNEIIEKSVGIVENRSKEFNNKKKYTKHKGDTGKSGGGQQSSKEPVVALKSKISIAQGQAQALGCLKTFQEPDPTSLGQAQQLSLYDPTEQDLEWLNNATKKYL
jgi:hypothetical protein